MLDILTSQDIKEIKGILDGNRKAQFVDLITAFTAQANGAFEILKSVGSVSIRGENTPLHKLIKKIVKSFNGDGHKTASDARNLAKNLASIF